MEQGGGASEPRKLRILFCCLVGEYILYISSFSSKGSLSVSRTLTSKQAIAALAQKRATRQHIMCLSASSFLARAHTMSLVSATATTSPVLLEFGFFAFANPPYILTCSLKARIAAQMINPISTKKGNILSIP